MADWEDARPFDSRLQQIDCKLIFLKATPETIWDRTIQLRKDNPFITRYAKKYGSAPEAIHAHFVEEQKRLESLVQHSALQTLTLCAEESIETNGENAYAFWKED